MIRKDKNEKNLVSSSLKQISDPKKHNKIDTKFPFIVKSKPNITKKKSFNSSELNMKLNKTVGEIKSVSNIYFQYQCPFEDHSKNSTKRFSQISSVKQSNKTIKNLISLKDLASQITLNSNLQKHPKRYSTESDTMNFNIFERFDTKFNARGTKISNSFDTDSTNFVNLYDFDSKKTIENRNNPKDKLQIIEADQVSIKGAIKMQNKEIFMEDKEKVKNKINTSLNNKKVQTLKELPKRNQFLNLSKKYSLILKDSHFAVDSSDFLEKPIDSKENSNDMDLTKANPDKNKKDAKKQVNKKIKSKFKNKLRQKIEI